MRTDGIRSAPDEPTAFGSKSEGRVVESSNLRPGKEPIDLKEYRNPSVSWTGNCSCYCCWTERTSGPDAIPQCLG